MGGWVSREGWLFGESCRDAARSGRACGVGRRPRNLPNRPAGEGAGDAAVSLPYPAQGSTDWGRGERSGAPVIPRSLFCTGPEHDRVLATRRGALSARPCLGGRCGGGLAGARHRRVGAKRCAIGESPPAVPRHGRGGSGHSSQTRPFVARGMSWRIIVGVYAYVCVMCGRRAEATRCGQREAWPIPLASWVGACRLSPSRICSRRGSRRALLGGIGPTSVIGDRTEVS